MRLVFTVTLFVSSFLLFLIQPLAGKLVLPTFGGAPAVWSASLVFFQATLLAGYAYAHFSSKYLGHRQWFLHLPLMATAFLVLPFGLQNVAFKGIQEQAAGGSSNPSLLVVMALAALVGLPFFVVSAGAPLLQRWFGNTNDPAAKDPYFLYGASNVGSMLALFAYPAYVESQFRLAGQAQIWTAGFGLLFVGMAICGFLAARGGTRTDVAAPKPTEESEPTWKTRLLWLACSAVPTSFLMGVTSYVSTNIAPVPLLWVVPLAIYLITFLLAFTNKPLLNTALLSRIVPIALIALVLVTVLEEARPEIAAVHLVVFFLAAWMCHSRLYDLRPGASRLTEFYLYVSLGGVLGGIFNGLLAPTIFNTFAEYPIAIAAVAFLKLPYKKDYRGNWIDIAYGVGVYAATAGLVLFAKLGLGLSAGPATTAIALGVPCVLCALASDRPLRFGLAIAGIFFGTAATGLNLVGRLLVTKRSFFGLHRVALSPSGRFARLVHGNTLHGMQDRQNPLRPLTYYYSTGPIGQVFSYFTGPSMKRNVALVGLGVGSLAAYGEKSQRMTFFEIDPEIEQIARDPKYFTFLRDSKAKIDVVLGDARLTLTKQPAGSFGLIVLDAFSSDAIPVHLLTKEAMEMYMSKLEPGGILAYHISNRYLTLEPVVANQAKELGLVAWSQEDGPSTDEKALGKTASSWMVIARKRSDLAPLVSKINYWSDATPSPAIRAWTDDYSNVLSVFEMNK